MAYKDKEKQKQASKERARRYRAKIKGVTPVAPEGVTVTPCVTPKYPSEYGLPGCACMMCRAKRSNKSNAIINHGPYKRADRLSPNELNRVPLPGDIDYSGIVKLDEIPGH